MKLCWVCKNMLPEHTVNNSHQIRKVGSINDMKGTALSILIEIWKFFPFLVAAFQRLKILSRLMELIQWLNYSKTHNNMFEHY